MEQLSRSSCGSPRQIDTSPEREAWRPPDLAGPTANGDDGWGPGWLRDCTSGRDRGICGRRMSLSVDPAPPGHHGVRVTAWTVRAAATLSSTNTTRTTPPLTRSLLSRGCAATRCSSSTATESTPAGTPCSPLPRTKRTASARRKGRPSSRGRHAGKGVRGPRLGTLGSARPLYQAGEYAEVADRLAPWSQPLRSTPCCSSTSPAARVSPAGRVIALDHLRHAIEMSDEFRDSAKGRLRPGSDPRIWNPCSSN